MILTKYQSMKYLLSILCLFVLSCDEDDNENQLFSGTWYLYSYKQCKENLDCENNCEITEFPMIASCEIIHIEKWTFNNNNTFTVISPYQTCNSDGSWNTSEFIETLGWTQSGNTLYLEHPDGNEPIYESTGFQMEYIQSDSLNLEMVLADALSVNCLQIRMSKNKHFDYEYDN